MSTGALTLVETAVYAGVEVCFANPGTTEMPIVVALDRVPGMRVVLGLFEGVCTGAADGWARMTGRPAATLLHLGPGLANGLANLHNARRARTPVVNWIGDHATRHLAVDSPLTSDIVALTGSVGWTRSVKSVHEMAQASLAAVEAALGPPGRVASLIIPADCQWEPGPEPLSVTPSPPFRETPSSATREAAALLRKGRGAILLGSNALTARGLHAAARVAAATTCGVWIETFPSCQECGRHVPFFPLCLISRSRPARHLRTSQLWCWRARANRSPSSRIQISLQRSYPMAQFYTNSRTRTPVSTLHLRLRRWRRSWMLQRVLHRRGAYQVSYAVASRSPLIICVVRWQRLRLRTRLS